jgi:hypothetical protein
MVFMVDRISFGQMTLMKQLAVRPAAGVPRPGASLTKQPE